MALPLHGPVYHASNSSCWTPILEDCLPQIWSTYLAVEGVFTIHSSDVAIEDSITSVVQPKGYVTHSPYIPANSVIPLRATLPNIGGEQCTQKPKYMYQINPCIRPVPSLNPVTAPSTYTPLSPTKLPSVHMLALVHVPTEYTPLPPVANLAWTANRNRLRGRLPCPASHPKSEILTSVRPWHNRALSKPSPWQSSRMCWRLRVSPQIGQKALIRSFWGRCRISGIHH